MQAAATLRLHAYRLPRQDGWTIEADPREADAFLAAHLEFEPAPEEHRIICEGLAVYLPHLRCHDDYALLAEARRLGWQFDEEELVWWEPGRVRPPPDTAPVPMTGLAVSYTVPKSGNIGVCVEGGGQKIRFTMGAVFDPLPGLLWWLDQVLEGGYPRLCIELEGEFLTLTAYPGHGTTVRAVIRFQTPRPHDGMVDVLVERRALVAAFYGPLRDIWDDEDFTERKRRFRDGGAAASSIWDGAWHYPVRRPHLDAVLDAVFQTMVS